MSQVQSASSAYYSTAWLYQSTQQSGPSSTSADSFFGASDATQGSDPFSALAASTQSVTSPNVSQPFSLDAMSALIAAQAQQSSTPSSAPLSPDQQKVFSELDANGDGTVTKSELETDFGPDNKQLADAVFNKLDTNGDGSISEDEFAAGTKKTAGGHHHHHHGGPPPSDSSSQTDPTQAQDPLQQLLGAATPGQSTQSVSNSDGSTTTTVTYADGSTVSTTSAPTATSSDNNSNSSTSQGKSTQNLLEQLIQLQSQLTLAAAPSLTATI